MNNQGVTFESEDGTFSVHSYNDFGLVMRNPDLTLPEVKTDIIEIPDRDGVIDLTGALSGILHYSNRILTLTFTDLYDRRHYTATLTRLASAIHGKRLKVILDKDSSYYYIGRIQVTGFSPEEHLSPATITVTCDVEPYKLSTQSLTEPWKWDPFNFETGVIMNVGELVVNGSLTVTVFIGDKPVTPKFVCSSQMSLTVNGQTYSLPSGVSQNREILLYGGMIELEFKGNGTVSMDYRAGVF